MLRNRFFLAALAVMLIGVGVYNYTFFASRRARAVKPAASAKTAQEAVRPDAAPDSSRVRTAAYRCSWRRDPFWYLDGVSRRPSLRPDQRTARQTHDIVVEATMLENGKGTAIVNGQIVETGDRVQEYTVVAIGDQSVTLKSGKGTKMVHIARDPAEKEN